MTFLYLCYCDMNIYLYLIIATVQVHKYYQQKFEQS